MSVLTHILVSSALLLFFFGANALAAQQKYLFSPPEVTLSGARCLDGSPSGFYFTNATSLASINKWVINLVGGGFCVPNATKTSGAEDCYDRANGRLGSSNDWGAVNVFTPPDYAATWNIVNVPYCGGDLHSGTRKTAQGGLYYAGHLTVVAVIAKLKSDFGLNRATELSFSGGSAGGIGVFINIDQVKAMLPGVSIRAVPNAGWFINFPQWNPSHDPRNRSASALQLFTVANSYVNRACAQANPTNVPACMFAQFSWPYVKQLLIPFFVAESFFDTNQLGSLILNLSSYNFQNPAENQFIVNFGGDMRASTATANIPINGLFLTSEFTHGVDRTSTVNGTSLASALSAWYSKTGNYKIVDSCTTPNCTAIPLPPH